jgi:PIN domain nuclease of toxin-antitoxin system
LILIDTHVLIWLGGGPEKIGTKARQLLEDELLKREVVIAAITPWEISMSVTKGRLKLATQTQDWISTTLERTGIRVAPLQPNIAVDAGQLPGEIHGDPGDRIIIATARSLKCDMVTADREILAYAKAGHLQAIDARR